MMIAEIVMIGTAYLMSRMVNRFKRKMLFLLAFLILPVRAVLYTLVESPSLFLLIQALDGVAAGILGIMGIVINSDLAVDTGRFNFLQGLGAMSIGMGESVSQLFAGFTAQLLGFNISFLSLASVGVVGILFSPFSCQKQKHTKKR